MDAHEDPIDSEVATEHQLLAEKMEMPIRDFDKDPYTGEDIRESLDFELRHAATFLRMTDPLQIESMRMKFFANRYFECMYTAQRVAGEMDATGSPLVIGEILGARRSFTELMDFLDARYTPEQMKNVRYPYIERSDVIELKAKHAH